MLILYSFLFCGFICLIAQIILDNTKLSTGHITSLFVCFGAFLDTFNIYDVIINIDSVHSANMSFDPYGDYKTKLIEISKLVIKPLSTT